MAVVMTMRWAGVTPEQYDALRAATRWEEEPPRGAMLHIASFDARGARVTDVWESEADFERFNADRLAPMLKELEIEGEPEVEFTPLHRRFVVPGVTGAAS